MESTLINEMFRKVIKVELDQHSRYPHLLDREMGVQSLAITAQGLLFCFPRTVRDLETLAKYQRERSGDAALLRTPTAHQRPFDRD